MIHLINEIVEEVHSQGYTLTLRQIYYQLIAKDLFPSDRKWAWTGTKWVRDENGTKNAQPNYKWLIEVLTNARYCGLMDWDAIEDRTRNLRGTQHHRDPESILRTAANGFRLDKWSTQSNRVEVWVEKDALINVLEVACEPLDVDYFSCRGNTSSSAIYGAYERFKGYLDDGKQPFIIHLADHDPTGVDMTRDVIDRLETMVTQKTGEEVIVKRIALNIDQVRQYNPPPSPAKEKDSRYAEYVRRFGEDCWELDALEPRVMGKLITDAVTALRDEKEWDAKVNEEETHRERLSKISVGYQGVAEFVEVPERFLKLEEEPILILEAHESIPKLKSRIHSLLDGGVEHRAITIVDRGLPIEITASHLRRILKPTRKPRKKKSTSIKTKKKKSK